MSAPTLGELKAPLLVLRMLAVEFAHLPAPCVSVSAVYPNRLDLSVHDDLTAFEAWREALGLAPESVSYHEQSDGRTRVLEAQTQYAGAQLHLTGYAKAPAPARPVYLAGTGGGG
ncbi:hypothetical protein ACFYT4_17895 [Streptomyces sp. NPDC004609]|uniref:hypothetical protein n=1 Tax=Streptomyces sp. NPDC004609 TaxID=3364704 RepID=UPI00369E302C